MRLDNNNAETKEKLPKEKLSLGFIKPTAIAERIIVGEFEIFEFMQHRSRNIWYTERRREDALVSSYVAVSVCLAAQPNTSNVAGSHTSWLRRKSGVFAVGMQSLCEIV